MIEPKGLLSGEFFEEQTIICPECGGFGYIGDYEATSEPCEFCEGQGEYEQKVPVSWATIKEIYAMAVKHLEDKS